MKTRTLSDSERGRIIGMHEAGATATKIATHLGHPRTTVYSIISEFKKHHKVSASKAHGQKPKFSKDDVEELRHILEQDRRAPLCQITNQLTIKASETTVRNEIHKLGFHSRIARRKPFLNDKQINNRLKFARIHQDWTVEDWKKVIWTDESSFEIGKNFRQV
jgi:transposase